MSISGGEVLKARAEHMHGFLENRKEARETRKLWTGEGKGSMNITVVGSFQGGLEDPQLLGFPFSVIAPFECGYHY